jgi:iron complex outermembrane receptor protein
VGCSSIRRIRLAAFAALAASCIWGQGGLADASLEQLLNTPVMSVSKKQESLAHTAAAVFVISQEDIRRSGALTLPDVLRLVPGVEVAQINNNSWAISIRGFKQRYSNKVLVLIDGRSVYTPAFSAVYWDQIDLPLENIERIEVIRGPGSSAWGANAMNGVINIITKSARTTKGGMIAAHGDTEYGSGATVQYGGGIGKNIDYRAFGKYSKFGSSSLPDGSDGFDQWSRVQAGFRAEWSPSSTDSISLEGDGYRNGISESLFHYFVTAPGDQSFKYGLTATGGDVLGRWTHTYGNGSSTTLQTYYDEFKRTDGQIPEHEQTFDLDFQHHLSWGERQDIVWGLGYRSQSTTVLPGFKISLNPAHELDSLFSAFLQDQIQVSSNLWLTLGGKIEHNAFSGIETEPSARLAWAPTENQTLWTAASKSVRSPARLEAGLALTIDQTRVTPGLMGSATLTGNPRMRAERLNDYEAGYRRQFNPRLSLDLSTFLSFYNDLSSFDGKAPYLAPGIPVQLILPYVYGNSGSATDYGGETSLTWKVNSHWKVSPGYSLVAMNFHLAPGVNDPFSAKLAGTSPRHSFQARSWINLSRKLEFDQSVFWYSGMPNHVIPAHARVDARLGWKVNRSVEASLTGQNLLTPGFLEFGDLEGVASTEAPRSLIGKVTWRF